MIPDPNRKVVVIPFRLGRLPLCGVGAPPAVAPGGDDVLVNGVGTTDVNFNDTTPAASAGSVDVLWQRSGSGPDQVSIQTPAAVPVVLSREMTDINVVNSTTETDIFNFSVPANAMGTDRTLDLYILLQFLQNAAASKDFTFRLYFGGTKIFDDLRNFPQSAVTGGMDYHIYLGNQGAANDQTGGAKLIQNRGATPTVGINSNVATTATSGSPIVVANGIIDTAAAAATLRASMQMSAADVNTSFTRRMAVLMVT